MGQNTINLGSKLQVSVVVPLYNEAESLEELFKEITSVFARAQQTYEVIFVNDGSKDKSQAVLDR